jgi:hypothetical protein
LLSSEILEIEAQRELQIALATAHPSAFCEHFSEGIEIGGIESDVRCTVASAPTAPVGMVDEIESFGAELKASLLTNSEILEESNVPVLVTGLLYDGSRTWR